MRILIWTDVFWPEIGGLELFCQHLVEGLRARGHDLAVFTDRRHATEFGVKDYQGVAVHEFGFEQAMRRADLAMLRRQHDACGRALEDFQPDVVHLNSVMRGPLGFLLQQRQRPRPAVLTPHDHALALHAKGAGPGLIRSVDIITAISRSHAKFILACDSAVADRLRVIPNALPDPGQSEAPFPAIPRLLAVGRLSKEKGFDLAIRAFVRVAAEFPALTLSIVGEGPEGAALRQLAAESSFAGRIHFIGWVAPERVAAFMEQHSIILMPSRWQEPFGLVALQSAQAARPIIAGWAGALPEIVQDGVTGRLVEGENVAGYGDAIRHLLNTAGLAESWGLQARAHATRHFSFAKFLDQYELAYGDAVASFRRSLP